MNAEREQRLRLLDRLTAVLGALAFIMLALRYGFPQFQIPRPLFLAWGAFLPIVLFLESLYRLLWAPNPWKYLAFHPLRYIILLMIVLELSGVAAWSLAQTPLGQAPPSGSGVAMPALRRGVSLRVGEIYLAIVLLAFAGSWAKGALLANRWLSNRRIPLLAFPAVTFGAAILAGTVLLAMPGLHRQPISLLDSLFTVTSAICVTGLAVYDISTALNPAGLAVLAFLIQIGGLGTMTVLGMMALWQHGALTLGERAAFGELVGGMRVAETRRMLRIIVRATLLAEGLSTLAFWLLWRDRLDHALLKAAFHSISAFCNAGFALFSDSFASFRSDPPTLIVLMLAIIAGGAGFPVLANLARAGFSRIVPWRESLQFSQASRVVLTWSGALIAAGTILFLADGWLHGTPRSLLEALFQSVTTRTAGFQTESQLRFGVFGLAATIMLMMIGASPQSTGGGIKTTVFARLFKRMDPRDPSPSSKRLTGFKPFRIALLLTGLYLLTGTGAAGLLLFTDRLSLQDALFEAFSALGTVGLSRDITPLLSPAGKCIDIALMFCGRVLYPSLVMHVVRRRRETPDPLPWT